MTTSERREGTRGERRVTNQGRLARRKKEPGARLWEQGIRGESRGGTWGEKRGKNQGGKAERARLDYA